MSTVAHLPQPVWRPTPRRTGVTGLAVAGVLVATAAAVALGPVALALPVAGVLAVALVRAPLVLYVAFLYIGVFKDEAFVKASPVDPTLLLLVLLVGVCAHRLATGRVKRVPRTFAAILALLVVALVLGLLWTPAPDYGGDKALRFVVLTLPAALAPFFLVEHRSDLVRLLGLTAVAAVAGAVFVELFGSTAVTDQSGDRLVFGDVGNTILTSRFLLNGAIILLLAALLGVWPRWRVPAVVAGALLVAIAASIGSRGPVIALVLALVFTVVAVAVREPRRLGHLVLLVAAGIALFPLVSLPTESRSRLQNATRDPVGTLQFDERGPLYQRAIDLTASHPLFGVGTGGYEASGNTLEGAGESYPHNLFLETSSEFGIPVALLLGASVVALLAALLPRAWIAAGPFEHSLMQLVVGLFLINLIAAQFTGDFNDNRTFWAAFGLAWLVASHRLTEPSDQSPRHSAPVALSRR